MRLMKREGLEIIKEQHMQMVVFSIEESTGEGNQTSCLYNAE